MADVATDALRLFLDDAPARIARVAAPEVHARVDAAFKPAAASIGRQAAGNWSVKAVPGDGFELSGGLREFSIGEDFARQCMFVESVVLNSTVPDLRDAIARLTEPRAAILSAFFHYFAVHELLHVEQGLGSQQYKDSDYYMPIVMEADHVADVAGLAITLAARVPELSPLAPREQALLLIAVHIASMHSFGDGYSLDAYAFSRLLVWYLHFARFTKSSEALDLSSITMLRPWIVTFPRLVGREDHIIDARGLDTRIETPYAANSDVALAYHHEDGIFRIHRAVLTDSARIGRLCHAILTARFDTVRHELEEVLVNNPALVPARGARASSVEWAAGTVIERLQAIRDAMPADPRRAMRAGELAFEAYLQLVRSVRLFASPSPDIEQLVADARSVLQQLLDALVDPAAIDPGWARLRVQALSLVDQIAVEHSA